MIVSLASNATYTFASLDCLYVLHSNPVNIFKFVYACIVRNSVTSTDDNKLQCIHQKFSFLCFNRSFVYVQ